MKKETIGLVAFGGLALVGILLALRKRGDAASETEPETAEPTILPPALPGQERPEGSFWARMGVDRNDDDIDTLGRILRSESATQSRAEQAAVAWVARNKATEYRKRLLDLFCRPCGKQGERQANGRRRQMTTRLASTPATRELGAAVLDAPQSADPTQGATSAFEPALQDKLAARGRYRHNAAQIRERWRTKYKLTPYGTVGRWELWGRPKASSTI